MIRTVNLAEMFARFPDFWSEHLPVADEETHVLLLEPKSTLNTGNVRNERTVPELERL